MADAFQPRFVDLVRNYSTTVGTSDFVLGPAVNGYSGFASALSVGDRFYYSAVGVDKPAEREVGRGTLLANGVVRREPVSGPKTSFTTGTKSIALIAAAEWFDAAQMLAASVGATGQALVSAETPQGARSALGLGSAALEDAGRLPFTMPDRAALAALGTTGSAYLREAGREGTFVFDSSNLSAQVTADTAQGIYVPPSSDTTGASGAWVRKFTGPVFLEWFGGGTAAADNAGLLQIIIALFVNGIGVRLNPGTYNFSSLVIPNGISLIGSGRKATTINITGDGGGAPAPLTNGGVQMFGGRVVLADFKLTYSNPALQCLLNACGTNASVLGRFNIYRVDFEVGAGLASTQIQAIALYLGNLVEFEWDQGQVGAGGASGFKQAVLQGGWLNGCKVKGVTLSQHTSDLANGVYADRNPQWDSNGFDTFGMEFDCCTLEVGPNGFKLNGGQSGGPVSIQSCYLGDANTSLGMWLPNLAVTQGKFIYPSANVTGDATSGSAVLANVSATTNLYAGQKVTVIGAGTAGANLTARIVSISGTNVTLTANAGTSVVGTGVYYGAYAGQGYRATVAGTTGATQPAWPTAAAATVADGTVTWMEYGTCAWIDAGSTTASTYGKASVRVDNCFIGNNICGVSAIRGVPAIGPLTITGNHFYLNDHAVQTDGASIRFEGNRLDGFRNLGVELKATTYASTFNDIRANQLFNVSGGGDIVVSTGGVNMGGSHFGNTALTGKGASTFANESPTNRTKAYPGTLTAIGSIGYATGAGGTVTQATSKATGVTLNKVCGQITMNAAALAANTSVAFTLTNSQIAATDTVLVTIASGATTNSYLTQVEATAAGSCRIQLRNISAGSLSEAVVLNFAVIKAVTA